MTEPTTTSSSLFDRLALENLATTLGLTGTCPSTNGQGIGCTQPRGHKGTTHSNQWGRSFEPWDDDHERDRAHKAREVGKFLAPVIQQWKISDVEEAVGYAFVDLLANLDAAKGSAR